MSKGRIAIVIMIIILFIISITISIIYIDGKYVVKFETGSSDKVLNQYVKRNGVVSRPNDPKKDGYVFVEWQNNGILYDFNTKVTKDITLTAKWMKEEYITVDFIDNDTVIESIKIVQGSKVENLKELNKEGYKFLGWYLNNSLYENTELYEDTKLIAQYSKVNTFDIGDKVLIKDKYARSAYDSSANYYKAIGWTKYILGIYEDGNYKYKVGDEKGAIGFFKEDAIELITKKDS